MKHIYTCKELLHRSAFNNEFWTGTKVTEGFIKKKGMKEVEDQQGEKMLTIIPERQRQEEDFIVTPNGAYLRSKPPRQRGKLQLLGTSPPFWGTNSLLQETEHSEDAQQFFWWLILTSSIENYFLLLYFPRLPQLPGY